MRFRSIDSCRRQFWYTNKPTQGLLRTFFLRIFTDCYFSRKINISVYSIPGTYSCGRTHALRKTSYCGKCIWSLHAPHFFVRLPDHPDAGISSKTNVMPCIVYILRDLLINLKNVQVLAPPILDVIELWRQCQRLAYRRVQASNGTPLPVKHERHVRTGANMTKTHEEPCGVRTQQGLRCSGLVVLQTYWTAFELSDIGPAGVTGGVTLSVRCVS